MADAEHYRAFILSDTRNWQRRRLEPRDILLMAFLVLGAVASFGQSTYPLLFLVAALFPVDRVISGRPFANDSLWILWELAWATHALLTDPRGLFGAMRAKSAGRLDVANVHGPSSAGAENQRPDTR